jgi:hypothetical protein
MTPILCFIKKGFELTTFFFSPKSEVLVDSILTWPKSSDTKLNPNSTLSAKRFRSAKPQSSHQFSQWDTIRRVMCRDSVVIIFTHQTLIGLNSSIQSLSLSCAIEVSCYFDSIHKRNITWKICCACTFFRFLGNFMNKICNFPLQNDWCIVMLRVVVDRTGWILGHKPQDCFFFLGDAGFIGTPVFRWSCKQCFFPWLEH